jgi:hypothetical protein
MGVLTDLLGHYLGLPSTFKSSFLAESRVEQRAHSLVEILHRHLETLSKGKDDGGFPPSFSLN